MGTTVSFYGERVATNEANIQEFLNETAQSGNAADFIHALGVATRAKG